MDLKELDVDMMYWMELGHDKGHWRAIANATLNLQVT